MCLLVVSQPHSTPKKKDLECASCNNPHGFGYAVIAGDKIITGRGMSAKKMIKEFLQVREQYPDSYAMYHARYATHGVKNQDNCHPFKVPYDKTFAPDTYLAHNGILDVAIHATDRRSDTRVFAEDTLPAMGGVSALDDDNVWRMVSKFASGSKIAIFTLDPSAKDICYIINEDAGHWDNEGNWWSNSTYKPSTWSSYIGMPSPTQTQDIIFEDFECTNCRTIAYEDANPYYCEVCFTCFDCNGAYGDSCLCWSPEYEKYKSNQKESWYYDKHFDFAK
jgi:glutamine amidotransferase